MTSIGSSFRIGVSFLRNPFEFSLSAAVQRFDEGVNIDLYRAGS